MTFVKFLARHHWPWLIVVSVAFLTLFPSPTWAADWTGKTETRDGVLHVINPAAPIQPGETSEPKELWRLGGDTDDEDEFFGVIAQILSDQAGNIYVLDSQLAEVKIYTSDGEFVRSIGREGEGPGEFRFPTGMFFIPNGNLAVMQVQPGKIVMLTTEGEPAGEYPLPPTPEGGFINLLGGYAQGGNVVMAAAVSSFAEGRFEQHRYLASVDAGGNETARYYGDTRVIEMANAILDDQQWDTFDRRWTVGHDGLVYACVSYPDYQIHVWNPDGSVNRIIERQFDHRKRTVEEKELVTNLMSIFAAQIPNCTVKITDWTKDVENIFVREDGSVWTLNSNGARDYPEGSLGTFDVFDSEGRFVREITLKGEGNPMTDGYFFLQNRLYVVTDLLQAAISMQSGGQTLDMGDDEPEPMSVICYELDGNLLTSSR